MKNPIYSVYSPHGEFYVGDLFPIPQYVEEDLNVYAGSSTLTITAFASERVKLALAQFLPEDH